MPFKRTYTYADARAAIDRSNGQTLANGPRDPANRVAYNDTGGGLGHEYMHRGYVPRFNHGGDQPVGTELIHTQLQGNQHLKSRTLNRETSYRLAAYLLNSNRVQNALQKLDGGDRNQQWIKRIPVNKSMALFGYARESETAQMIQTGAINFRAVHGNLFIASVYPDSFVGLADYDYDNYDLSASFIA